MLTLWSAQSTVTGPREPIVALLGEEITLPCDLYPEKNADHMEICWYRVTRTNVKYHDGENVTRKQLIEYSGRISLLNDDLTKGSTVLKIHQVRVSDEGEYQCVLQDDSGQRTDALELKVAVFSTELYSQRLLNERMRKSIKVSSELLGKADGVTWGTDPQIDVEPLKDGEILLLCRSNGWYPKPQVGWQGVQGESLLPLSESHSQDGEDLFQIEASLVVQANYTKDVFCSIWHPLFGKQKTASFPSKASLSSTYCAWILAFVTGLQIMGLFILGSVYFIRKQCKARENQSQNEEEKDAKKVITDAGWRRAWKHAVQVTLDPATAHPILILSDDQSQVTYGDAEQDVPKTSQRFDFQPCVLGSKGFNFGRHYWEVEVGTGAAWTLGVCREAVNRKGWIVLSPEEGFWTMRFYKNCYEALSGPVTPLPLKSPFSRVGVYLDYEAREVSFYNVTDRAHIYTFPNCSFSGTICPFFWVFPGAVLILPRLTKENLSLLEGPSDCRSACVPGELSPAPN
ncbi:butyrophilin subfamily 1 member A1-like [Petaurus breviceps papuanus]|uniref:butyrophilin subfamily 1 member A1-like n=1 Tax=Petaurus breviceps papuanus TaxID=3040969 RepID=UPI0036D84C23